MTVKLYFPGATLESAVMVSVDVAESLHDGVTELGVNLVVMPVIEEVLNVTVELKQLYDVTVIVDSAELPAFIFIELGLAETKKYADCG